MPVHAAEALILRTYRLGEADRIVVFLTADRGKRRGVARGARRPRSKFAGALEPLSFVRIEYFERERRDLVSLNYVDVLSSPLSAGHPDGLAYVGYFADLVDEWAQEADPNERLFRLGVSASQALNSAVPPRALARYFEFWLLRLQGVYPSYTACAACGASLAGGASLAPGDRVFQCGRCIGSREAADLSAAALQFLRWASQARPGALRDDTVTPAADAELEVVHRWLMVLHLEREPRSVRVLRDLRHHERPA